LKEREKEVMAKEEVIGGWRRENTTLKEGVTKLRGPLDYIPTQADG
jgi:hypothetical protein